MARGSGATAASLRLIELPKQTWGSHSPLPMPASPSPASPSAPPTSPCGEPLGVSLSPLGPVVPRIAAGVVAGLVDRDPGRSRHTPSRRTARTNRKGGFKRQTPSLRLCDGFGKPHSGTEVPVLAHDDRCLITQFMGGLHQINGQTDVNTLLPPPRSHPACIYVDALVAEMLELVRPKAVPETLDRPARHTGVEANFAEGARRNSGYECTCEPLHVIAGPCIRRRSARNSRCPSALREVEEVLAVDQHEGAHNKKHPPEDGSRRSVQRAGK